MSSRARTAGLQPHWPDRLAAAVSRRRGGRRIRIWRRMMACALLLCAGALAIAQQRQPAPGIIAITLARDLPAGWILRAGDLAVAHLAALPDGAQRSTAAVTGRMLAGPARRGEVITDARLVPLSGPDPGPGRVAVPIRPADPGTVDLLGPGIHVTVISVAENGTGVTLAADAVVLSVAPAEKSPGTARLVVLGVPVQVADRLAAAAVTGSLALRFT